jgi:hypothetical protein
MGITAASLATLRPLLRRVRRQDQSKSSSSLKFGPNTLPSTAKNNSFNSESVNSRSDERRWFKAKSRSATRTPPHDPYTNEDAEFNFCNEEGQSEESVTQGTRFNPTPKLKAEVDLENGMQMREVIGLKSKIDDNQKALAAFDFELDEKQKAQKETSSSGVGGFPGWEYRPRSAVRATWWPLPRSSIALAPGSNAIGPSNEVMIPK